MFSWPDRRFWYLFIPVVLVFLANAVVDDSSAFARPLELLLYVAIALLGFSSAALDIREGYCLNRPSVTRQESPFGFWLEVLIAALLGTVGVWKLWLAL